MSGGKWFLCMAAAVMLLSGSLCAGEQTGRFGIGGAVTESSPVLTLVWWPHENITIEPGFGIIYVEPEGESKSAHRLFPTFGVSYHLKPGAQLRPYLGGRFALDIGRSSGATHTDIMFGPAAGAEYFFSDNFSVVAEYVVTVTLTDEVSPSFLLSNATYVSTGVLVGVAFYF
jgi:hypothetical protein